MKKTILLFTFAILLINKTKAQCDIMSPNQVYNSSTLYDLNNDGVDDILVSFSSNVYTIAGQNGTEIETNGSGNVKSYNPGVTLGVGTYASSGTLVSPSFPVSTDKFMGVKIPKNGFTYCGWIYLQYSLSGVFLNQYGVNSSYVTHCISLQPNICIKTGESGESASIESPNFDQAVLKNKDNKITLEVPNSGYFNVAVYNILGNKLAEEKNQLSTCQIATDNFCSQSIIVVVTDVLNRSKVKTFRTAIVK